MTTPSGTISLNDVNVELGFPGTTLITMNQADVRTLAGVGGSGTVITMNNLRGKSNRVALAITISSDTTNYNLASVATANPSYVAGKTDVTLTINSGVTVYSTSTGTPAFSTGSFTTGDTISFVNQGIIVGKGGNGGGGPGGSGNSAGPGLNVSYPVTMNNQNRIAGGGGGGGGGGSFSSGGGEQPPQIYGGGGGGGGTGQGSGGPGGPGSNAPPGQPGSPGSLTSGGAGGRVFGGGQPAAGPGGAYGSSGSAGQNGGAGGGAGPAIVGYSNITFQNTGTISGPTSG